VFDPWGAAGAALTALRLGLTRALAGPLAGYLLHTGNLTADPRLVGLWRTSLACLAACLVVPLAVAGLALISGHRGGASAREALTPTGRQLAPLATALAALPATALEVGLANRLVDALLPAGEQDGLWQRMALGGPTGNLAVAVGSTLLVGILVVVAVLALARWATLWLLVALAPIAMGFALLPGPGAARLTSTWWRLQAAAVFLPVAQATALAAYVAMFLGSRDPVAGAFAGVAVLVLVAKLPSWVAGVAAGAEFRDFTLRLRGTYLAGRAGRDLVRP